VFKHKQVKAARLHHDTIAIGLCITKILLIYTKCYLERKALKKWLRQLKIDLIRKENPEMKHKAADWY
jgi:predicted GIY-YIG superfamily endonuclease